MLGRIKRTRTKLHHDEQGADMVEYILIVAAIALPLLAVVVIFWDNIKGWMYSTTEQVFESADEASDTSDMPIP